MGDSVAARRRYLAGLAEQAKREQAAEAERARQQVREERVRIARELHDVVAHTLAVITIQAGVGRRLMAKRPEKAAPRSSRSRRSAAPRKTSCAWYSDCCVTRRSSAALAPAPDWPI